jgi:hypothetical protein
MKKRKAALAIPDKDREHASENEHHCLQKISRSKVPARYTL